MDGSQTEPEERQRGVTKDWKAFHAGGKLVVLGWVTFPTPNYGTDLKLAESQGDDPADLQVERVVTYKEGYQGQAVKAVDLKWEHKTDAEYDTVTIVPDGTTIEVVRPVSSGPVQAKHEGVDARPRRQGEDG